MPTTIAEFHGSSPLSPKSVTNAALRRCPFIEDRCKKVRSGGACSIAASGREPVIICPNRLYYDNFAIIRSLAEECFGATVEVITAKVAERRRRDGALTGNEVVAYGQGFSGEIGIKAPSADEGEDGTFKIDFLLATVNAALEPTSILAIEVQTIDTTNSYSAASEAYYAGAEYVNSRGDSTTAAGFNWENVTKRILPQIIYKGHALRRERLAQHGLYFVLPHQVYEKIKTRVGGSMLPYPKGPGTVTFKSYGLSGPDTAGERSVIPVETFTTTVEQIAFAFVSPQNLPPMGVYEENLQARMSALSRKRKL